ncbi:MAG: type II toxin-antitoxin system RelB/DinJ family antitoxin [Chloroflexi bacterium]|nr:type II toxin-antitoxin system RelB/DinJ family antitoxin [Chloroflexota bacterium]
MDKASARGEMVKARLDPELKRQAEAGLAAIGLTPATAVTLLYKYVAINGDLPLDLHIPNDKTLRAIEDARSGVGIEQYKNLNELMTKFR